MPGTPGGKPKPKAPVSGVAKAVDAKRKADAQAASDHNDQRTLIHQAMKDLGINKIDSTTIDDLRGALSKYSVAANGQTLKEYQKQADAAMQAARADAAQIRKDRAAQIQKMHQTSADKLKETVRKPKPGTGAARGGASGAKGSGKSSSGSGTSASDRVKKAWITRKKNAS